MRILLLIDALDMGGAETHVITLAKGLQAAGHCVWVVSSGGRLEGQLTEGGVTALRFPASVTGAAFGLSFVRHILFLRRLHRQYGFDILHAHTRRTALMLRAYRLCERLFPSRSPLDKQRSLPYRRRAARRLGAPALVVTAHAKFTPRYRRLSYWGDTTIAVSQDLKSHVAQAFFVPRERVTVIPNGIDERVFYPAPVPDKTRENTVSIVFASRLDGDCSAVAEALIRLAPRLAHAARERAKRLSVTVIGGGDQYTALKRQTDRLGALYGDGLVHMVGATDCPAEHFRRADIFVGVSRAALEAMACGCMVILAGNEGYGGLVTEQNFDALAKQNFCARGKNALVGAVLCDALYWQILQLFNMPVQRQKALSGALVHRVHREFSAARMCERTLEVYGQTLNGRRRLNVLIGGYAGCGNLGDDAILRCLIRRWHHQAAPVSLAVSNTTAVATEATLSLTALSGGWTPFSIPCVSRTHWFRVLRALLRSDAFVLGGGALLQNCSPHGARSLAYYLALLLAARLCGCPFSLVANGAGPIEGRLSRALTARILRMARGISVRDEQSRALLIQMGLAPDRIAIEPDPVLSLCPDRGAARRLLCAQSIPERFICIFPRPTFPQTLRALTEAIRRLWQERGIYPLFFALDRQKDTSLCCQMIQSLGVGALLPCKCEQTVAGVLAQSRGVVSLRLHGLILAGAANAPAVCIPYSAEDEKTVNFARSAGQAVASAADLATALLEMAGDGRPTS
jgi:polysaccharide pyruvyl transferase CsaB